MITGYVGTYNSTTGKGIYQFSFDEQNGKLADIKSHYPADDAKCAILNESEHKLAITLQKGDKSGVALLDTKTNTLLDEILQEKKAPCFIKYDKDFIYTANYHDGVVMVYQVKNDKLNLVKRIEVVTKAGCHQVMLCKDYLVVPCLLIDEVRIFDTKNDFALVQTLHFPKGTGPRHGVFTADFKTLYLVSELSHEFFVFDVDCATLNFTLKHKLSLLPNDTSDEMRKKSTTAAIRLTKDEQFIYVSTRGADILTVISINDDKSPKIIQQVHEKIAHPRDFLLSYDEQFLLVVNRDSDDLVSFKLNSSTGKIENMIDKLNVPKAVGITLEKVKL